MAFTRFVKRNIPGNDTLGSSCSTSSALLKWCPLDVVLWLLVLCAIAVFFWKVGRRRKTTISNSKGYRRLILPYPQSPPSKYEDISINEQDSSTSTLVDPFLITNSFDNSLISQDVSFKHTAMPEAMLKRKQTINPSALDLPEPMLAQPPPNSTGVASTRSVKESTFIPPVSPPPAYVRSPSQRES